MIPRFLRTIVAKMIYLDYNATTPLDDEVIASITDTLKNAWENPSSSYKAGERAKNIIPKARKEISDSIFANASDIVFVSGGTEANNWVISTAIEDFNRTIALTEGGYCSKPHVVTTTVEHDSISLPLAALKKRGVIDVTFVPVNPKCGCITAEDISQAVRPNTCLVTVMMANNETGTIMPIKEICYKVRNKGQIGRPLIHTDAAQALGKIPVDVKELGVDYLTLVGHKFYGPRIGALYVHNLGKEDGSPLCPLFYGGAQERNYRPGTENTPMIAGLGKAASIASNNLKAFAENMSQTRDYLEKRLVEEIGDRVLFNCTSAPRLPNTSSISFVGKGFEGYKLVKRIKGFNCSTGSACHSNECQPSQVLLNFHISSDVAANTIRISTGRSTTLQEIDAVVSELKEIILRSSR